MIVLDMILITELKDGVGLEHQRLAHFTQIRATLFVIHIMPFCTEEVVPLGYGSRSMVFPLELLILFLLMEEHMNLRTTIEFVWFFIIVQEQLY